MGRPSTKISMKTAERLKSLRESANLKQYELAEKIDANKVSINRWEKGKQNISDYFVQMYSDFFKCSKDYVRGLTDNPQGDQWLEQAEKELLSEVEKNLNELSATLKLINAGTEYTIWSDGISFMLKQKSSGQTIFIDSLELELLESVLIKNANAMLNYIYNSK